MKALCKKFQNQVSGAGIYQEDYSQLYNNYEDRKRSFDKAFEKNNLFSAEVDVGSHKNTTVSINSAHNIANNTNVYVRASIDDHGNFAGKGGFSVKY